MLIAALFVIGSILGAFLVLLALTVWVSRIFGWGRS
jgi:hypothetical protein